MVGGRRVATARFAFPDAVPTPVAAARSALLRQVGLGAVLAAALATLAALLVTRRVSRPLLALTDAARAVAAGEREPDALPNTAPGELGRLSRAFADMAAQLRRQERLRRAVIADVSHELRTPVTILRGQTEALLDGIAEPTPDRLVSLHDEVLRLGRLTDDLATLSAADAAGITLRPADVDLGELTRRAAEAMRGHLHDAGLRLEIATAEPVHAQADAERVTQMIANLLTNAAKFTPAGGGVTVSLARSGGEAVLTVADTGPGIPADELPHVFERFWRGRSAGTRSGSGVGLAVVQALVTAHGGNVGVTSPPGGGARFVVRLPAGTG